MIYLSNANLTLMRSGSLFNDHMETYVDRVLMVNFVPGSVRGHAATRHPQPLGLHGCSLSTFYQDLPQPKSLTVGIWRQDWPATQMSWPPVVPACGFSSLYLSSSCVCSQTHSVALSLNSRGSLFFTVFQKI